jgi:hypothetical protein
MPKKRRRKGDPRDDGEDFQMMDIDFNPPPSIPIATTSTSINISQWHIDGDRIHRTSSLASIEDPTAVTAPSATDSTTTTQATFEYNDLEVDSTFYDADEDIIPEDIIPEHDPSAKRSFLAVSHSSFYLTTITAVLKHVLFIS